MLNTSPLACSQPQDQRYHIVVGGAVHCVFAAQSVEHFEVAQCLTSGGEALEWPQAGLCPSNRVL